jgi:hypothetical protein
VDDITMVGDLDDGQRSEGRSVNVHSDTRQHAISVRQPWAWAIVYGGKDVENRSAPRRFQPAVGHRVLIHASKTMSADEYAAAVAFMAGLGVRCPAPPDLAFGGIVGSAIVTGIVTRHHSLWFRGPAALVRADARPEPFRPVRGQLGLWRP